MPYEPVQGRLQYVLQKYGVEPVSDITLSYCSMANELFSFDTDQGRFYLKNCLKNNSRERIALEVALSAHLQANGMPCPEVVPTPDGEPVVSYNGFLFLMTRAFDGTTPKWHESLSDWHIRETMRGLGRFHRAAASFPPERDSDRIKTYQFDRLLSWFEQLERQLHHAPAGKSADKMLDLLPRFRSLITQLRSRVEKTMLAQCKVQMIHGDFHCFNAFFRDGQLLGCCDFDFIRRDLRLFDLWWCIHSMINDIYCPLTWGDSLRQPGFKPDQGEWQALITRAVRECVDHYRQACELSDQELAFLPLMPGLVILNNVQFFDPASSEEECADHIRWFTYLLDGHERHVKQLQTALAGYFSKPGKQQIHQADIDAAHL